MSEVRIDVLGRFEVTVGGTPVPGRTWTRRHAALLVKLLALAPGRRLHREQVMDALWPDDAPSEAAPKLHKAAYFARRVTQRQDAVVLRHDSVALFPNTDVRVDAVEFEELARRALGAGDVALASVALARYGGELLPDDRYEEFIEERRSQLMLRHLDLLRVCERWEELVEIDPGDEQAHVELMRRHALEGDRHAALRQFDRMDRTLRRELGLGPGPEAIALRDRLLTDNPRSSTPPDHSLVGRDEELAEIERALEGALAGQTRPIVVKGPPGIGKSSLLRAVQVSAAEHGWRIGCGTSAPVEGAWPYAPIVEALADLCRRHTSLLDGLADIYRDEIERVLAGAEASWSGETGHQRLFVAAAELMRLAAGTHGLLLTVDDLHDADDASLRLLHYLARATLDAPVVILVAFRSTSPSATLIETLHSLAGRLGALEVELRPLGPVETRTLIARHLPDPDDQTVGQIEELAAGIPFSITELARRAAEEPAWVQLLDVNAVAGVPPATRAILQRVAVIGTTFDTDEFVALSGVAESEAFDHLDAALAALVVERAAAGYRFRHGLVRDALLADLPPHRRRGIHREVARRLAELGGSPAQIGHHLMQAGEPAAAVEHLLRAAETEAAIGAYRDALDLVDAVRAHANGDERARALALRADLLMAIGDPTAIPAYREALDVASNGDERLLRARLARAAVMSGDLETASAAMQGIEPDGGRHDGEILLAKGNLAYFSSDFEAAHSVAEEAQRRVLAGDKSWQVLDLVALQGLLAHHRGEWFDRMRVELRRTRDTPEIANAVFDGYLCPAEYLLYGPTPYAEVIEMASALRATAERGGALRAVAFATALIGEAALLSGDLERAARELGEAGDLHHDLGSAAGEAHCLQRLAEVHLAGGDRAEAVRLLNQALPLARWSMISMHLLQRIYGTMIAAAADPLAARAVVDRAESTLGVGDACPFCSIMLSVPAAIACADSGDVDHARHHLALAERSAMLWAGTAWEAALTEARAHLALADGERSVGAQLLEQAGDQFRRAGHPLDAERCARKASEMALL